VVPSDLLHKDVKVTAPGQTEPPRVEGQVTLVNGLPTVQYAKTDFSGAYEVSISGSDAPIEFAAQSDPAESNLTPLSEDQIKGLRQVADVIRPNGPEEKAGSNPNGPLVTARIGHELWWPLMIAALIAATLEVFMAQYFSKSK
jgi:hypothetical protein